VPSIPYAVGPVVVVLTGGASRRMGSHKPVLDVGGRPLVARVLAAAGPWRTLVVGPGQGVPDEVQVVRERVPGGGPVAGLAAAVEALGAPGGSGALGAPGAPGERASGAEERDVVVVLAADLPFVTHAHLDRLVAALATGESEAAPDLAVTVDRDGRTNWLCAAWRTTVLRARLESLGDPHGRRMRDLADGIQTVFVDDPDEVALDVDTPADLGHARRRAGDA
jgi:molybdopterin-guanine dinucleotide biosynthesis protein A